MISLTILFVILAFIAGVLVERKNSLISRLEKGEHDALVQIKGKIAGWEAKAKQML